MTLEELRALHGQKTKLLRALVAVAEDEKRDLTPEEERKWTDVTGELAQLVTRIKREEILEGNEDVASRAVRPPVHDGAGRVEQPTGKRFRSLGEQLTAVRHADTKGGHVDQRLFEVRASGLNEGTGSEGGWAIQNDFAPTLLEPAYAASQVASLANRDTLTRGNGTKIFGIDETSRADGSRYGGVRAYWAAEAATVTATKPKFKKIELELEKLFALCYVTDEELEDAPLLEGVIRRSFTGEMAFKLDDACVEGDGAGKPLGFLAAPALVTVDKEVGQAAATIVPENIVKIFARMPSSSIRNAVWFINQDTIPQLYLMSVQVGVGGVPIYLPPGGLSAAPFGTLLGRPVQAIEQASTLGTKGDIAFVDMKQYELIDKGGVQAASSIHVQFLYDEMVFRFTYRVDGQPIWSSPLTPFKGTGNTVSPFVTLAVRA
jgi:HK97 family phage major capsid protein